MEMIRVYNRKTGEVLEKTFDNPYEADSFEVILDFLMAEYERFHDGECVYHAGEPVYKNEWLDDMSDEDWEQELNDEEDFDDEKIFE